MSDGQQSVEKRGTNTEREYNTTERTTVRQLIGVVCCCWLVRRFSAVLPFLLVAVFLIFLCEYTFSANTAYESRDKASSQPPRATALALVSVNIFDLSVSH